MILPKQLNKKINQKLKHHNLIKTRVVFIVFHQLKLDFLAKQFNYHKHYLI